MLQWTTKEDHSTMGSWDNCDDSLPFKGMCQTSRTCRLVLVNRNTVPRLDAFIKGCSDDFELVFVAPLGTIFSMPVTGNEAWTSENINCSSLEAVMKSAQLVLTGVAHARKRANDRRGAWEEKAMGV